MIFSSKGLKLLMEWEGCKLNVYADAGGKPTIGVGHLIQPHEKFTSITTSQALDLLDKDIQPFEQSVNTVNGYIKDTFTQDQFDALVIFTFNIGIGAFKKSTVLKEILKGELDKVPAAMRMWNKAGGKVCQGLVNRREKEIKLWNGEI